jgi:hypothetical protein
LLAETTTLQPHPQFPQHLMELRNSQTPDHHEALTMAQDRSDITKLSSFNIRSDSWPSFSDVTHPSERANRKIHQELVNQRELDLIYIRTLQELLTAHGIQVPQPPNHRQNAIDEEPTIPYMQDGSFESLDKTMSRLKKLISFPEIHVEFRDVGFWGQRRLSTGTSPHFP